MNIGEAQGWVMIVVAVTSGVASVIAAYKANSAKADTAVVKSQQVAIVDTVTAVADTVNTVEKNTNSRVSKQDDVIKQLSGQVAALTAQIAQQEQNRAVLAAEAKVPPVSSPQ